MAARILVVEDDEELNEVVAYNLTRLGYEVEQLWDGDRALARLQEAPPDLLLLDIMLPGTNGWELCRYINAHPELDIPIVIFTAKGAREDFDEARRYNVAGFFTKPYMTADVIRHAERLLQRRSGGSDQPSLA
jgi:DNA-binding response OmpR family regulator